MATPAANSQVDAFIEKSEKWQAEFAALRRILSGFPLMEALKWGAPCYSLQKKNIVLMHGFKDYCALLFFKGALLKDADGILIQQTENVQAARQIRFARVDEIVELEAAIRSCIH